MKREEIISTIVGLSHSQGLYGRLYEDLCIIKKEDEDYYNQLMSTWEDCKFDHIGLIEFIEVEDVNIWSVEDILRWKAE